MRKYLIYMTICICFISTLNCARTNSINVEIETLRKTLLERNTEPRYGLGIKETDSSLQVIKKLESNGSKEAISVLLEFLTDNRMDRKLKQHALTALGRIETKPAIEAIKQFETWSQRRYTNPLPFYMGLQEHAVDHFASPNVRPVAQTKSSYYKKSAIILLGKYEQSDVFLTSSDDESLWSEPILINLPEMPEIQNLRNTKWNLNFDGDSFTIKYNDKTFKSTISEQLKDTDKDGLPDIVEVRLSTDPEKSDSDGDGVPDGKDSNPLTPKHKKTNDTTEIRQAVFSALFATTNSRDMINIVDRDEFAKQEYHGFSGPIIKVSESIEGMVNITSIDITSQSKNEATANITDWEASLAASGHVAKLKKIHAKWVVVEFSMTWIS